MRRTLIERVMLIAVLSLSVSHHADATSSRDLRNVKVLGFHFTTSILGMPKDISVQDPSKARFLVMTLSGTVPGGGATLFAPDFVLVYSHTNGSEDRADCVGIGDIEDNGTVGTLRNGPVARLQVSGESVQFALAFLVESDVERVNLYVGGQTAGLEQTLGPSRPYSVFLSTNGGASRLTDAERSLQDAGDYVSTSVGLNEKQSGVVVIYRPDTATLAQEISQRLMLRLHAETKLETFDQEGIGLSDYDVLVWLGK